VHWFFALTRRGLTKAVPSNPWGAAMEPCQQLQLTPVRIIGKRLHSGDWPRFRYRPLPWRRRRRLLQARYPGSEFFAAIDRATEQFDERTNGLRRQPKCHEDAGCGPLSRDGFSSLCGAHEVVDGVPSGLKGIHEFRTEEVMFADV
jgi:hypothetical protein